MFIRLVDVYMYYLYVLFNFKHLQAHFACLRCAVCGHFVSAESPCGRLELFNLVYSGKLFNLYKYCKRKLTNNLSYCSENIIFGFEAPKNPMLTSIYQLKLVCIHIINIYYRIIFFIFSCFHILEL